jgi:hypothetical protein
LGIDLPAAIWGGFAWKKGPRNVPQHRAGGHLDTNPATATAAPFSFQNRGGYRAATNHCYSAGHVRFGL